MHKKKKKNERGLYYFVKWACAKKKKKKINERGLYYFVKWSCANKRNKLARTLSLD